MLKIGDKDLVLTPFDELDEIEREAAIAYARALAHKSTSEIPAPWLRNSEDPRRLAYATTRCLGVVQLVEGLGKTLARYSSSLSDDENGPYVLPANLERQVELAQAHLERLRVAVAGLSEK